MLLIWWDSVSLTGWLGRHKIQKMPMLLTGVRCYTHSCPFSVLNCNESWVGAHRVWSDVCKGKCQVLPEGITRTRALFLKVTLLSAGESLQPGSQKYQTYGWTKKVQIGHRSGLGWSKTIYTSCDHWETECTRLLHKQSKLQFILLCDHTLGSLLLSQPTPAVVGRHAAQNLYSSHPDLIIHKAPPWNQGGTFLMFCRFQNVCWLREDATLCSTTNSIFPPNIRNVGISRCLLAFILFYF